MPLKFLQETNQSILGKLKIDLSYIDSTLNLDEYAAMTIAKLSGELSAIRESIKSMKTGTYGSWLREEQYVRDTLVEEALRLMIDDKRGQMREDRLIPGATYYSSVSRFGSVLEGQQAIFLGARYTGWMKFSESTAVAKATQVMRHGSEADFREIYIGLADGSPDALNSVSMNHITESSDEALALIEEYCDSRWDGPWPWEVEAPEKLKFMIERREEKHMKSITEMQHRFGKLLREFDEGSMNQFEMVAAAQEMMSKVDSIIKDLGQLSSTGIQVMAQAKASGDEQLVDPMQNALGEPLNGAVSALIDLKTALASATGDITGGGGDGGGGHMGGAPMGDHMGSPADAMGDDPMAGGGGNPIDDIDIGGDDEERPMKEI